MSRFLGTSRALLNSTRDRHQGWTPANLSNLECWYKADVETTPSFVGSSVTQWNDQSGNGRTLTPNAGGREPELLENQINGRPALVFISGSSDNMWSVVDAVVLNQTTASWFFVIKMTTTGGSNLRVIILQANGVANDFTAPSIIASFSPAANQIVPYSDVGGAIGTPVAFQPNESWAYGTVMDGTNGNFYRGNTLMTSEARSVTYGAAGGNTLKISFSDVALGASMAVGEVLMTRSALSQTERDQLHNYLYARWFS